MKLSNIFLSIFSTFIIFSCKDNSTVTPTLSKKEMLTGTSSKTWKSTKAEAVNANGLKIDLVNTQPACMVDNLVILSNNGTFELKEGFTKCNPNDPDSILKANWSLSGDEKYLSADKIIFAGFTFTNPQFELLEISSTKFVGKAKLRLKPTPQSNEQDVELTATFEAVN